MHPAVKFDLTMITYPSSPSSRTRLAEGRLYRAFWSLLICVEMGTGRTVEMDLMNIIPGLSDQAIDNTPLWGLYFGLC